MTQSIVDKSSIVFMLGRSWREVCCLAPHILRVLHASHIAGTVCMLRFDGIKGKVAIIFAEDRHNLLVTGAVHSTQPLDLGACDDCD